MNRLKSMTKKTLKTKICDGWPTQRFLDEYEITPEEFEAKIIEIFPAERARNEIHRNLKQNDKRFERHKNTRKMYVVSDGSETNLTAPKVVKLDTADYVAEMEVETEESPESELESLTIRLNQVETEILEKLEEKKGVAARCDKLAVDESALIITINQLKATLSQRESDLESLRENFSNEKRNLSKMEEDISSCNAKADSLKEEIRKLKTVNIFVYENGEISIEDANETDEIGVTEEWEDIYVKFSHSEDISKELDDCLETFTRGEMKVLAKLYSLFEVLKKKDIPYEVTSDIEKLEYAVGLF
jgi:chromosome segregation ATPase